MTKPTSHTCRTRAELERTYDWKCFPPGSLVGSGPFRFNLLIEYWNQLEGLIHLVGGCSEQWRLDYIERGETPIDPRVDLFRKRENHG